jgi:hypothetical protein
MQVARDSELQMQAVLRQSSCNHDAVSNHASIGNDASIIASSPHLSQTSASSEAPLHADVFDFEIFSNGLFTSKWRHQKGLFLSGKLWTGSSQQSIFGRIEDCSHEKDEQHNFHCKDCVFDEETTFHNGRDHALKFKTLSDSKDHVFVFETASDRQRCLAQFKI